MTELKCVTSYKRRLDILNKTVKNYDLNDIKHKRIKDKVIDLALHDKVYAVKEMAFRICQKNDLKKNGKSIFLGKKDIKYKSKDFIKVFNRIKRDKKMTELNIVEFIETFKILNPEMLDVMSFEKGKKLNQWIENLFKTLPKT